MRAKGNSDATTAPAASPHGAMSDDLVSVALIVKTRGVSGEVAADLLTDFPERFDGLKQLIAVTSSSERIALALKEHWLHGRRIVLKFAGYDSPEAAAALIGCELAVPEAECVELGEDEFYEWQLTGCRVETIERAEVGTVREVLHTGAAPVLIIRDGDGTSGREHLVPLAGSICVEIDIERKLIRVDPPEGLLEF